MGDLVDEYNRYLTSGENNWWGCLHNEGHPDDCMDCIEVHIWDDNNTVRVTLYPTERDIDEVDGIGVDQWVVDTSRWFDVTEYLFSTVCIECLEYKPDDDRVYGGMKCGECAYG